MADNIKEYTKGGKTYYKFKVYTGINPKTGKKSQTTKSGFTTKAAAKSARRKIQAAVADGTYWDDRNDDAPKTLGELFEEYKDMKRPSVKPSTMRVINATIKRFKKLVNYKLAEITSKDIQKVIADNDGLSVDVKNDSLAFIRRSLEYAQKMGYIQRNPAATLEPFKDFGVKEDKVNFYTPDELKAFLKTMKGDNFKYYVLFRLAAFSGMRIGEVFGLQWDCIDWKENTVTVKQTVVLSEDSKVIVTSPKTENSSRIIEIDKTTIEYLKQWHELNPGSIFVFESTEHGQPSYPDIARTFLTKFFKRHPELKPITPHGFRHTHASILFRQGINPKVIQKRLGHASLEMTLNVYTHLFGDFEEGEINKIICGIENEFKDS